MRTYEAPKITGVPNWEQIPVASIDHRLWSDVDGISPTAQLCWNEQGLFVRLQTREENIRSTLTAPLDPVCEDSCLEFFFCPEPSDDRYFNIEANPNGTLYVGYGLPGAHRCRLHRDNLKELLQVKPFTLPGGWGLELFVPADFIQIFSPGCTLCQGHILRANFFKCGDKTVAPHYMAWNKVATPQANFHQPEFFGNIILK